MGQIDGTVDVVEYLGADTYLIINCGALGQVTVRAGGESALEPGTQVGLAFAQDKLHYFDDNGNAL
jgi:multiple sugar transport system ATP-binding protein